MVQSRKRLLRKIIGTAKLTFNELGTAIIEVEALLNSQPLTYLSADKLAQPLTLSQLVCGHRLPSFPDPPTEEEDEYIPDIAQEVSKLTRRMKHLPSRAGISTRVEKCPRRKQPKSQNWPSTSSGRGHCGC